MKLRGNPLLRRLDRTAGIPLLAALGLARRTRPRPEPASIRRLGILKSAAIGDTLLLQGTLADLREQLPQARIVLFTGADNAGVVPLLGPVIDAHVVLPIGRPLDAIRVLRGERLDALLDIGAWPRMDALLAASAGCFCAGFRTAGQHRHFAYDVTVPHEGRVHETEHFRRLAAVLGVAGRHRPTITVPDGPAPDVEGPYAVFHPRGGGYRSYRRDWPVAHWQRLARWCAERGWRVLVSGSPGERAEVEALAASLRVAGATAEGIAGRWSLVELARVLRAARAVVSVDTGVLHLAALAGAPTVGLYGPTPRVRWGAIGPRVTSLQSPCPGSGFTDLGFEYERHEHDCMADLPVAMVTAAIEELEARR